jgi:hypothetical protein
VDEISGLQRVADVLATARAGRDPAQFLIDERNQIVEGLLVAFLPGDEESCDVLWCRESSPAPALWCWRHPA